MGRGGISPQRVAVWQFVRGAGRWVTINEIAEGTGVARRTAHALTRAFVDAGLFDEAAVSPSRRFIAAPAAEKRCRAQIQDLERAAEAMGVASK